MKRKKTLWGNPLIEPSGKGIDHWNRFQEDVDLVKQLGVTVYRGSFAWERIQPREEYFDEAAIEHYHQLFDELKKKGVQIMMTLHHFVNPGWFEDKGAFEKAENINYFVEFAKRMFAEFHDKVSYWCTINEPGVYAAQTYFTHDFPRPEIKNNFGFPCNLGLGVCFYGAALVTKHLMMTHIKTYKALKAMSGGDASQIGLVHQIIHFEPYHPGNWIETKMSDMLRHVYHSAITQFLITGELECKTLTGSITFSYPEIHNVQDFIGINYYSHVLFKWSNPTGPQFRPEDNEPVTDMYYGLYAEGIYRVIKEISKVGKPILVTENGLADEKDSLRELWYKRYLYAVNQAIKEGADVRMYCAWSAFDNFEWNLGYEKMFGLYSVDPQTYERKLKPGAEYFRKVAHRQAGLPHQRVAQAIEQELVSEKNQDKTEL